MATNKTKSKLAAGIAAITKNVLGADLAKPATVQMPKAIAEIHVSPDDVIPAGTLITPEIAELAELSDEDIDALEKAGHVTMTEVYAAALTEPAAA